jgi:hypothetical protein
VRLAVVIVATSSGCIFPPEGDLVVDDACAPVSLAVDDSYVYWTASCDGGSVQRASKADWSVTTLVADEPNAAAIAVDSDNVYWERIRVGGAPLDDEIVRAPKAGGVPVVLATGQASPMSASGDLHVDETNLYWTNTVTKEIMTVPKDGSAPPTRVAVDNCGPSGPTLDRDYVYWVGCYGIFRQLKGTSAGELVAEYVVGGLLASETGLYFRVSRDVDGATRSDLYWIAKTGGRPVEIEQNRSMGTPLAYDAGALYWIDDGDIVREADRGVGDGQGIDAIAHPAGLGGLEGVVIDRDYVYWVTVDGGGRIYRVPK